MTPQQRALGLPPAAFIAQGLTKHGIDCLRLEDAHIWTTEKRFPPSMGMRLTVCLSRRPFTKAWLW